MLCKKKQLTSFDSLQAQLQYKLPLNMKNTKLCCDSQKFFTKIEGLVKNIVIKPLLKKFQKEGSTELYRNRRLCVVVLKEYHQGGYRKSTILMQGLKSIHWTNSASFTAEAYTMQLLTHFNTIDEYGEPMSEEAKCRQLHESCYRKSNTLSQVTWIDMFKDNLVENMEKWTYHDAMTRLIQKYNMNTSKGKRKISSANSNGRGCWQNNKRQKGNRNGKSGSNGGGKGGSNGGGSSGHGDGKSFKGRNKSRYYDNDGKPMGRYINGIDPEPIFKHGISGPSIHKLPNIVKQCFIDNKGTRIPWDQSKYSTRKYEKGDTNGPQKAFIKAIESEGATIAKESEDDTQSQMSTASAN